MKAIKLPFFILLLTCFCACGNKPYPRTMQTAESLMNAHPDSAFALLEQLKGSIAKEPESIQMYYQLLTIKVKDKIYIDHTSDSLIMQVLNYYKKTKDKQHLPEAYFYAGRIYKDLGDAPQALKFFQEAVETSKGSTEYRLISLIYNQTGMLYLYQDIYDKSLDEFKKAYHYAKLSGDSALMVYALRDIGRAFTGLNKVDSTLCYYKRASQVAQQINNVQLIGIINQEVTNIYTQLGEYEKAYTSLRSTLPIHKKDIAPYYAVLSELYYTTGKLDSAQFYNTKLLSVGNYFHKQGGYEGLCKIARKQGKYTEAFSYMDKYLIYTDSIRQITDTEAVRKVNALYNYQLREKENHHLKDIAQKQENWIILLSASTIIAIIIIISIYTIYLLQKKQRAMQAEWQQEKLKEISEEQYRSSQQFISENQKRIAEIQQKLQDTQNLKNETEKDLQNAEKDLLELTNKQVETRHKVQALSEISFKESQIYKDFHHVAGTSGYEKASDKEKISSNNWDELFEATNQTYKNFTIRLKALYPNISEQELRICILTKTTITPAGIAKLTARSKQAITSSRKMLYEKVYNQKGTPDLWDNFIRNF